MLNPKNKTNEQIYRNRNGLPDTKNKGRGKMAEGDYEGWTSGQKIAKFKMQHLAEGIGCMFYSKFIWSIIYRYIE